MDAIEVMATRRSVRGYTSEMPTDEQLAEVLRAAVNAPTGRGMQSPVIIVVKDKALRDELVALNAKVLGCDFDPFYGAPCIIIVLADKQRPTYLYDGSLVMGNIMNAAHAVGLGSCWIHRAKEVFESERGKQLLKQWGVEGDYEGIGHVAIGYAAQPLPEPKERKQDYVKFV